MNYSQPRGLSLMEVMIAVMLLAITATAVVIATTSSMRNTRLSDETRAVAFAARKELEKYLSPMTDITSVKTQVAANSTFKVFLNDVAGTDADGVNRKRIELPGLKGLDPGEVILVDSEQIAANQLGRDLTGGIGPDGVSLCPLPMDFNGNGTMGDADPIVPVKLLIGIVVRWTTTNGVEQRYELWSVR